LIDGPGERYWESEVAKLYRPGTALYRQGLALALTIASSTCHDDRTLGEVVDSNLAGLCGGATCAGWCERPLGACDAPTSAQGICHPPLTPEDQITQLMMCLRTSAGTAVVCGCNGRSFRHCDRLTQQVSLFSTGACSYTACTSTSDCQPGEFCEFAAGMCNSEGTCQPGGPAATSVRCDPDSRPTCGCDGKTYPSECERRRAGVSTLRAGPCRS
jgi:hypothetical protein